VAVVAASVFLALNRPGAQASPDATITVNDTGDTNARDGKLTLREAMLLATGGLAVGALSQDECAQVSNSTYSPPCSTTDTIGSASADTIVFDPVVFNPNTIALGSALPALDKGNDTIDGSSAGVIVDGTNIGFDCLHITSASNTIKGLEIHNCYDAVVIHAGAQDNTIGGSSAGEGNVISGNIDGVIIWGSGTDGNVVKGNYIGTNASGTAAVANSGEGVVIHGSAQNNTVEGNVISGNLQHGVIIGDSDTDGNMVRGNYIGTNASGTGPIPNGGRGVFIGGGCHSNTIGGTASGEGNTIAFNTEDGVQVDGAGTTGNAIRGNSIHSNGGKGIENTDGGNEELPPPTITGFGSVMGTAGPNCEVDIYSDDEDEGRVYEGSTTADGDGDWSFPGSPEGPNITATSLMMTLASPAYLIRLAMLPTAKVIANPPD
jgi:parallel beta-helix repeat protein